MSKDAASEQNNEITFSIITATYNLIDNGRERSFGRLLDSLRNQNFRNFEYIVVDGNSSDGTVALLEKANGDGAIDAYISEPDNGIFFAFNKGAAMARGKYLLFIGSDDYYHNSYGFDGLASTLAESGCDYCYSPINVISEDGRLIETQKCYPKKFFVKMPFGHPGFVISKELFNKFGGYDEQYSSASDYDLIFKTMMSGAKGGEHNSSVASFQLGGYSSNISRSREQCALIQKRHLSRFCDLPTKTLLESRARGCLPAIALFKIASARQLSWRARKLALGRIPRAIKNAAFIYLEKYRPKKT